MQKLILPASMQKSIRDSAVEQRKELFKKELQEKVEEARERFKLDEFWLEFTQKEDLYMANVIRNGWNCYPHIPSMKVNSIVFHVIYSKGYINPLWVLPREQSLDPTKKDGDEEFVHNSQKRFAEAPILVEAKSA